MESKQNIVCMDEGRWKINNNNNNEEQTRKKEVQDNSKARWNNWTYKEICFPMYSSLE